MMSSEDMSDTENVGLLFDDDAVRQSRWPLKDSVENHSHFDLLGSVPQPFNVPRNDGNTRGAVLG